MTNQKLTLKELISDLHDLRVEAVTARNAFGEGSREHREILTLIKRAERMVEAEQAAEDRRAKQAEEVKGASPDQLADMVRRRF